MVKNYLQNTVMWPQIFIVFVVFSSLPAHHPQSQLHSIVSCPYTNGPQHGRPSIHPLPLTIVMSNTKTLCREHLQNASNSGDVLHLRGTTLLCTVSCCPMQYIGGCKTRILTGQNSRLHRLWHSKRISFALTLAIPGRHRIPLFWSSASTVRSTENIYCERTSQYGGANE